MTRWRDTTGHKILTKLGYLDRLIDFMGPDSSLPAPIRQRYSAGTAFGSSIGAGASAGILLSANRNAATIAYAQATEGVTANPTDSPCMKPKKVSTAPAS